MAIIKQDRIEFEAPSVRIPEVEDLDLRLQSMIDEAEDAARRILDSAVAEAHRMHSDARRVGHEAGIEEGRIEGRAEAMSEATVRAEVICASWSSALELWDRDRTSQFRSAEDDLIKTALQLAEVVVRRSIAVDPTLVRGALQSALALVRRPSDVVIRINSSDEEFVSTILDELVSSISACRSVRLQSDDSIEVGGCRLELEGGAIDATIGTQLERIGAVLLPCTGEGGV